LAGEDPGYLDDTSMNEQLVLGKEAKTKARALSRTFSLLDEPDEPEWERVYLSSSLLKSALVPDM
jgi:hypothetical protein